MPVCIIDKEAETSRICREFRGNKIVEYGAIIIPAWDKGCGGDGSDGEDDSTLFLYVVLTS